MREKGFVLILALGVMVFAIVAGFVGLRLYLKNKVGPPYMPSIPIDETPTPQATSQAQKDETVNWKIYSDDKNTFSIKYPSDWFAFPNLGVGSGFSDVKDIDPHDDYRYKIIVVNTFGTDGPFDSWYSANSGFVEEQRTPDNLPLGKLSKINNLTIDGQPAIKFIEEGISPPADPFLATIIWVKKGTVFKIQLLQPTQELHDKYKDTFNQMVETFKFVPK